MNIQELLKTKKVKRLLKILISSLIPVMITIVLIGKIKINNKTEQDVKISVSKDERTNYPKTETVWGILEIPSLKINANIYRGTTNDYLNYGLVHHKESYFPTDGGTILIAGNNTFLKDLPKIKTNDTITIKTLYGTYKYKVEKTRIKSKENFSKQLEINSNEERLILYAPYPETNGYKSDRLVVYAK